MTQCSPFVFILCFAASAAAQPRLIKDINVTGHSTPHDFVAFRGKVYFSATDATHGTELWCSDGTSAGTRLVRDLVPGRGSSTPGSLRVVGDRVLFVAKTGTGSSPWAIWSFDGTVAGMRSTGGLGRAVALSPAIGKRCYYDRGLGSARAVYWVDNRLGGGKAFAGTYTRVSHAAELPGKPGNFVFWKSSFFSLSLMSSDGSAAGPRTVRVFVGAGSPDLLSLGGKLLLVTGGGLWETDGSPAGTKRISTKLTSQYLTRRADKLIGLAQGKILETDGTARGTRLVATVPTNKMLAPLGGEGRFAYLADRRNGGIWETDGTATGTRRFSTLLVVGSAGARVGGTLLFAAVDPGGKGVELFGYTMGANAWPVGSGCGTRARVPTQSAAPPFLGKLQPVTFKNIKTGSGAVLAIGSPLAVGVEVSRGCKGWVDPRKPFILTAWLQATGTTHVAQVPIPNETALKGLFLAMQAFVLPTDAPVGFDVTNAVFEVLGN